VSKFRGEIQTRDVLLIGSSSAERALFHLNKEETAVRNSTKPDKMKRRNNNHCGGTDFKAIILFCS
jgi:hypothetical protein